VSELSRNILLHAGSGEILIRLTEVRECPSIDIAAIDVGPGIADVRRALRDGYSTCGRLGIGLPGVRRLSDEFEIVSQPARGTTIRARKLRS
jgi:serine/threonine-protein kinase RsbT